MYHALATFLYLELYKSTDLESDPRRAALKDRFHSSTFIPDWNVHLLNCPDRKEELVCDAFGLRDHADMLPFYEDAFLLHNK